MSSFENLVVNVTWSVDDGYVGGDRPQNFSVKICDYYDEDEWNQMMDFEKKEFFEGVMKEEFENNITYNLDKVDYNN